MFLVKDWEVFHTNAINATEDSYLVDQISIDRVNKRYVIDIGASDLATDGYDEAGDPVNSTHVSRLVFDIIVEGLKQRGFKSVTFD